MSDLPASVRNEKFMRWILRDAARSVKLTVCYNSEDRPPRLQMKGLPPGSVLPHVGTGTVVLEDQSFKHHRAYKAGQSFLIQTAAHVVYDNKEAEKTRVEFFLDDDIDRSNVVQCQGVCVVGVMEDRDICQFICEAKDPDSARQIHDKLASHGQPTFTMSPNLDVAWTISYPHGLSQRLTVGKVKEIDETNPYLECNLLKLLIQKCSSHRVDMKDICYVFFKEHVRGIAAYLSDDVSDSYKSTVTQKAISHLQNKHLISLPNRRRHFQHIRSCMQQLDIHLFSLTDKKHNSQTSSSSWGKVYEKVVKDESSKLCIDKDVEDRLRHVCTEVDKTVVNLRDDLHPDTEAFDINKLVYSLHTCPGSSGTNVWALQSCEEGVRVYSGTHSRGLSKNQGNMAGECNYILHRWDN